MPIPKLDGVTVLVTGGAGFIGSHLCDALLERGAKVRVLDNLATGSLANLAHLEDRLEFVKGDLRDVDACAVACEGAEYVFHQAALGSVPRSMRDPATSIAVNVSGTANLWAAARDAGARRIVYASSSSVYGDSAELPKREGREGKPLSPYATSKRMCEELADVYGRCFDLEFVGLRYFNVYGPRQSPQGPYAAVIPRFFDACLNGELPRIHGDGQQSRDFTFVGDAVRANLLAAGAPEDACGRAFNVAAERRTTVLELARHILTLTEREGDPIHEDPRPGDVAHSLADLTASRERLGYEPQTDLFEGLRQTHVSYRIAVH